MTQTGAPFPQRSRATPPPTKPVESLPVNLRSEPAAMTPLWVMLAALALLIIGFYLLFAEPVNRKVAASQPTRTHTPQPTDTLTPTFTPSPLPSATPTLTPTPQPRVILDPAKDLRSVKMFDALDGWGVGERSLWHTQDGGKTWADIAPPMMDARSEGMVASFLNADQAWYLVPDLTPNDNHATLFVTKDAGKQWSVVALPFGAYSPGMFFLDEANGWILTSSQSFSRRMLATTDGGLTWKAVHSVPQETVSQSGFLPADGGVFGPVFSSPVQGWVVGAVFLPQSAVKLFASADGGRLWTENRGCSGTDAITYAALPKFFDSDHLQGVMALQVFTPNRDNSARWVFCVTANGGQTWQTTTSIPAPAQLANRNLQIAAATPQNFFFWVGDVLYVSADGGKTWMEQTPSLHSTRLAGLNFLDAMQGWAWSTDTSGFKLYHSINGGLRWEEISVKAH